MTCAAQIAAERRRTTDEGDIGHIGFDVDREDERQIVRLEDERERALRA